MQYLTGKLNLSVSCLPQIGFGHHDIGHLEELERESCPSFSGCSLALRDVVACSTTVSKAGSDAVQRQLDPARNSLFSVAGAEPFE